MMEARPFNSHAQLEDTPEGNGLATTRVGSPELADSYQTDVSDDMERFNLASTASAQGAVTSLCPGRDGIPGDEVIAVMIQVLKSVRHLLDSCWLPL